MWLVCTCLFRRIAVASPYFYHAIVARQGLSFSNFNESVRPTQHLKLWSTPYPYNKSTTAHGIGTASSPPPLRAHVE
ncbi:hypothetical protein V8F06_003187 [Rhypophila decipiens]